MDYFCQNFKYLQSLTQRLLSSTVHVAVSRIRWLLFPRYCARRVHVIHLITLPLILPRRPMSWTSSASNFMFSCQRTEELLDINSYIISCSGWIPYPSCLYIDDWVQSEGRKGFADACPEKPEAKYSEDVNQHSSIEWLPGVPPTQELSWCGGWLLMQTALPPNSA